MENINLFGLILTMGLDWTIVQIESFKSVRLWHIEI